MCCIHALLLEGNFNQLQSKCVICYPEINDMGYCWKTYMKSTLKLEECCQQIVVLLFVPKNVYHYLLNFELHSSLLFFFQKPSDFPNFNRDYEGLTCCKEIIDWTGTNVCHSELSTKSKFAVIGKSYSNFLPT